MARFGLAGGSVECPDIEVVAINRNDWSQSIGIPGRDHPVRAICEAVTRPSMRFVPTKSEQQQSSLMLHRSRQILVRQRTMLSYAIRGNMAELGIISAKGRNGTAELLEIIADPDDDRIPGDRIVPALACLFIWQHYTHESLGNAAMDVFCEYKPIRNKIAHLAVEEALGTIWSYGQYLQIDNFRFPPEIEVSPKYMELDFPQQWLAEWELELLAKEVIINGNAIPRKDRMLRNWKTLSENINLLKAFENDIYKAHGSAGNVLVELIRIAHRQFNWQGNPPNSAAIIRNYKVFNRPGIDEISRREIGLSVWEIYMCATACMGFFLEKPAIAIPFKVEIKALSIEAIEKFFAFTCHPLAELRVKLKSEQEFNADFAYAYNSLRAYPLVRMTYQGRDAIVCPLMTLLYWRFTSGLYYDLIKVPEFANEFGEGFQNYVGEVIERACPAPMQRFGEEPYTVGKAEKRSVDWIVADDAAALFVECKAKRLSWGAKASLDTKPLERDIDSLAGSVVQVYKTLADHLDGAYPHFPARNNRKLFPLVVTLENWRFFGPIMGKFLTDAVSSKLAATDLPPHLVEQAPYSIWSVEDLEVGLQIMHIEGIAPFMDGKLQSSEMRDWDWRGFMTNRYKKHFPCRKLFENEYDEMFAPLYRAQESV